MKKEIRHGGARAYFIKRRDRYDIATKKYSWKFVLVAAPLDAFILHCEYDTNFRNVDIPNLGVEYYLCVFNKEWWTGDLKAYAEDKSNKATKEMSWNHVIMRFSSDRCRNCNELFMAESEKIKFCCNDCRDAHGSKKHRPKSQ